MDISAGGQNDKKNSSIEYQEQTKFYRAGKNTFESYYYLEYLDVKRNHRIPSMSMLYMLLVTSVISWYVECVSKYV